MMCALVGADSIGDLSWPKHLASGKQVEAYISSKKWLILS